jgi:hypothetical protein
MFVCFPQTRLFLAAFRSARVFLSIRTQLMTSCSGFENVKSSSKTRVLTQRQIAYYVLSDGMFVHPNKRSTIIHLRRKKDVHTHCACPSSLVEQTLFVSRFTFPLLERVVAYFTFQNAQIPTPRKPLITHPDTFQTK